MVSPRPGPFAWLVLLASLALTESLAQDVELRASVDRDTVRENESFTYVLRALGQVRAEPDFAPLTVDFEILQRSRNTNIQMAGGQTTRVTEWLLQLMPRAVGRFTLPPVELAGSLANPLEIEVLASVAGEAPGDIFLEVEATPSSAYVQSEVIFTLRLFRGVSTGRSTLTPPEVSGGEAIIERLGEDREYQTVLEDRNFIVLERRYAIFPQASGRLTVDPVIFEAVVIAPSGFSSLQRYGSQALEIEVHPAVPPPAEHPDAVWLPARRLTLSERWSADGDELTAGVPQTRTLVMSADGVLETQLPEFSLPPAQGVRQYTDQPELEREPAEAGIAAQRTERFAVIAQSAGEILIPGLEIPWFNVAEERWEVASLPPRPMRVAGNPQALPAVPVAAAPLDGEVPVPRTDEPLWKAVSAGLLIAWLATLGLWWSNRRNDAVTPVEEPPPRRVGNRRLLRELRAACRESEGRRARALLLKWGALRFPDQPPRSLGTLAASLPQELAEAVRDLERSLYGPAEDSWDGARLSGALAGMDSIGQPRAEGGGADLLPLYR